MLTFLIIHFLAGLLLGSRFRFASLFAGMGFVVIEALFAAANTVFAPWYAILIGGLLALQIGYAAAFFIVRPRRAAALAACAKRLVPSRD